MRKFCKLSVAFIAPLLALTPFSVHAQAIDCVKTLIQDRGQLDMRETQSLAMSELLRRSSTEQSGWTANVTVPIKGVPIGAEASQAEEMREEFFQNSELEWNQDRLISVATQQLSRNAVEVFRSCMNDQRNSGPRILVHDATETEATITIDWVSPALAPTRADGASIEVVNGDLNQPFPASWSNNEQWSRVARRVQGEDLRITANIGGESDIAFVSHMPKPVERSSILEIGSCIGKGGQEGVRLWGPVGANCNGLPPNSGWGKYDAQVQAVSQLGSCIGHGGFEGVRLWGPPGESCGGMPNREWGVYDDPVGVSVIGISNCFGHGDTLRGHLLWGPHDEICGGIPEWGPYSEARTTRTSLR